MIKVVKDCDNSDEPDLNQFHCDENEDLDPENLGLRFGCTVNNVKDSVSRQLFRLAKPNNNSRVVFYEQNLTDRSERSSQDNVD